MRITLELTQSPALQRLTREGPEMVRRAGILAAKRMAESWVEQTQDWIGAGRSFTGRTGHLEQSIGWRPVGDGAEVYAQADYAGYVERGTEPHVIRPRPGRKALRFFSGGGAAVIRREVHHPGTDPMPFFFADEDRRLALVLQDARAAVAEVLGANA